MRIPTPLLILLIPLVILPFPTNAQKDRYSTEWDEFRLTPYDYEVSAGLREVQQLMMGRESLLQSYERTNQGMIETARAIEKLQQDRTNTDKTRLSYYEAMVNFKFPEPASEETGNPDLDAPPTDDPFRPSPDPIESTLGDDDLPKPIPPRIRIRSLEETEAGLSISIENLGDPIDALISVADVQGTIIATPYQVSLSDWNDPRHLSFHLLSRDDKINLLIQEASGKSLRIPLFIRKQVKAPRIFAFPMEQTANIGESVEYQIFIEGDGNDRQRYPIRLEDLPMGIAWQIAKVVPATTEGERQRSVAIRTIAFTQAFNQHELTLQLTLGRDLPKDQIGKPISFTLRIGSIRESLTITPVGIGELTIDLPAVVQARIGESKQILASLRNVGTEIVSDIEIRPVGTTYGMTAASDSLLSLAPNEHREIPVTLTIADDVSLGEREIKLVVSSSAGSQTAEFRLDLQPKPVSFASLASLTTPAMIILAIILAVYCGMKAQQWRAGRKQERADGYDLSLEVGGGD